MARLKNVRFRQGRLYTITFIDTGKAFVEFLRFKNDILYFKVIGSDIKDNLMFPGKFINGKKSDFKHSNIKVRNMNKAELVLYASPN